MVRPKKPTHAVELPRDCWEKIFYMYLEVAAPERSGVPEMPPAPEHRWQWDRFGNVIDHDTLEHREQREAVRKRRSEHTRACARTLIGLRRVCKLFREILDEKEVGGPMYDVMWRRVKDECGRPRVPIYRDEPMRMAVDDSLELADSLAPGLTSLQKLSLACEKGCQCCNKHPITRKVLWQFGVRICSSCARDKTVLERDLELNALVRPEHYDDLPFEYITLYSRLHFDQVRVRRFWKASVIKRREATLEREKRLRADVEAAKMKAEKEKKRKARLATQWKLEEVRAERKTKMTTILGKHVRDLSALEMSETFKRFSAVARPLSAEFETRHMRVILSELPNEALAPHAQHR